MQINWEILEKFFLLFDKKISDEEKKLLLCHCEKWGTNDVVIQENLNQKNKQHNNGLPHFATLRSQWQQENWLKLNKNSKKFLEKFFKYEKIFSICPFVKWIFIWNTVAFWSAKEGSDIDLFIVFENWKIWTWRFILSFLLQIFWVRRHWKKTKWRFCLSFFASEKWALELENIQIEKNEDIYLAIWTATLIPVFWDEKFFEEFFEKNKWVENYWIKSTHSETGLIWKKEIVNNSQNKKRDRSLIWNFTENFLRKILKKRSENKKNKIRNNYWIIISDDYLKFHDNDKRKEIMEKFS